MVSDAKPELFLPRRTHDDTPLDLTLPDQRVALLGPRGSGKSTLLRHLSTGALILDDTTPEAAIALAQANPDARIFASANAPIPGFTTYEILPLSTRDIDDYLHHYTPDPFRLHHQLRGDSSLYELLANPAILAAAIRLTENGIILPQQRAELYAWVIQNLGPIDHPAIHAYLKGTDFRLLAARMFRESGPEPVSMAWLT